MSVLFLTIILSLGYCLPHIRYLINIYGINASSSFSHANVMLCIISITAYYNPGGSRCRYLFQMGTQRGLTSKGCVPGVRIYSPVCPAVEPEHSTLHHGGLRLWHSHQVRLQLRDGFDLASLLGTETIPCPESRKHQLGLTLSPEGVTSRGFRQQFHVWGFLASGCVGSWCCPGVFTHVMAVLGGRETHGFPLRPSSLLGHLQSRIAGCPKDFPSH